MSRRVAPKQASQTRKPNRSGSPSMSRLSAALDAGTALFLGDFRRVPVDLAAARFDELIKIEPQADQPKGKLPRIRGQSERTW
jgi:hypothetical protein